MAPSKESPPTRVIPATAAAPCPHILMIPFGASGHFCPFVQLLYRVCAACNGEAGRGGVVVTVVSNEERTTELARMHADGEFPGVDLRLKRIFQKPPMYPLDKRFPFRMAFVASFLAENFEPFAKNLIAHKGAPGSPTCVVSDMYLSFGQDLARQLDIPWYTFYSSSPGLAVSLLESPWLQSDGLKKLTRNRDHPVDISGLRFARIRDVPTEALEFPEFYKAHAESMGRASAILINTAEELDAPSGGLEAIRDGTERMAASENRKATRVWALGPILDFPGFSATPVQHPSEPTPSCLKFLDTQAPLSVLYISFGSLANIGPQSMTELAHGLLASKVPFIWVLKFTGTLTSAVLPPEFDEKIRGWGFIETGWAPQAQILRHPSTGGFLSHCGWNSVLESLCSGVPLVTWPVATDQPLNARFVENVIKAGVEVKKFKPGDELELQPSREDVRKAVTLVMVEEEGKRLRQNAQKLKTILEAAVAEGGSSQRAMTSFLDEILLKPNGKVNGKIDRKINANGVFKGKT